MMRRERGVTLIELILVLVVLGAAMALVYPYFGRLSRNVELKAAAKKVSTILRYYRSEAVQKGRVYQIVFDMNLREIRVEAVDPEMGGQETGPSEESPKASREKYPLPEGIQVGEVKIPTSRYPSDFPVIEFYPNGASNGGSFTLERDTLKGYRIQVHFLTGVVKIRES